MTESKSKPSGKLAEIFAKMNMSELPAMSTHVQELISLVHSRRSASYDLSRVILKDYSLTNKVLQVVNSAYYSLGQSVSSISKAVTILGFDAVRDLATAIAIFEDFIKSGVDKAVAEIGEILQVSFCIVAASGFGRMGIHGNHNFMGEIPEFGNFLPQVGKGKIFEKLPGCSFFWDP